MDVVFGFWLWHAVVTPPCSCDTTKQNVSQQVRDRTVDYIEALGTWRESAMDYDPTNPRRFFWEGRNYTLKITRDLDFLADQPLFVDALQVRCPPFYGALFPSARVFDPHRHPLFFAPWTRSCRWKKSRPTR